MIKKSRNNLIHDGYSTLSHLLLKRKALFVFTFIFINLALLPSALATSDSYNTCETALYVDPQEETYVVHQDTLNYSNDDHDVYKVITTKAGEIELQISRRGGTSNEPTVIWSIYKNSCTLNNRLYSQTVDLDSDGDIYDIWTSEQDADPTTYYIDIGIVLPRDSTDAPYDFVIYFDPYVTCDPPGKAVNPNPSDGATGVQLNPSLSWTNGGGATSYAVYFGTSSLLGSSDYQTIVTSPTWRPPSPLQEDTTYYWRIDAKNNCPSGTTEGNIWSFTTLINNVPPTVEITEPSANITVDVGELVQIAWNGTDPDDNASVVLYRDPDQTYNNGNETIIISGQPEDGSKSWDTSGTPLGEYYILAKICDDEPSCSYAYSTGTVSIVGKPDFEPNTPSLEPDSNVSPGESLRVKGRIYNYGQITAPAAEHVILLNDIRDSANFTMRSIPLGKITTGSIAPGQYEEYDKIFEAPLILASGWDYFIVIACDYADLITEEHDGEDSNNRFAPLFGVPDHREAQLGTSGNSSFSGDPVNTALGNFTEQRTDLVIPGRGLNVTFTRYYNSQGGLDSPMGFYWNHSYNIYVHEDVEDSSPTGNYTVVYGDGRRHKYTPNGSGGYDPPVGVYATFIKNPDNSFTVTQKDQVKYNFDASGRLTSIKDRNNNTISFTYTGNNLTGITDTVGRQVSIQYNNIGGADRIISIQGPVRPAVIYGYDSYGNLTSVADARNNTTQYVYDPNHDDKHLLTKIVNVRGKEEIKNFYGKADGTENTEATPMGSFGYFVVRQQDADNKNTYYTYNLNDKVTTITGPDGEATEHHYDDHYRFVKEVDPNGDFVQFVYDENGNRTSVRDKMGRITSYTYDDRGNILTKTDPPVAPAATGVVTRIEYNDFNDPLKKTEAYGILNYEWNYTYDAKGNLETETDPEGNQTSYDYNSYGQLTGKTDANEKTTSYFYEDTYKNLTKVTGPAPSNCVTRHTYDDAGRKLTATDGLGNVTTYHYDNNDNLDWVEDGEGNRTNYGYDENNNRTSLQNARGYTTAYIYDNKDRLTIVRNPLDQEVTTYYDAFDRKERVIDQWGNLTRFEYDKVGNLSKVTNAKDEVTTYGYDKNGNKTDMWQPGVSEPWEYQFDEMNRLVWEEDPLNNRTSYEYNQMGWITNVTDAELRDTRFEYYKNGKLKRVIDPDQGETVCTYDPVGNRLTEQDARQNTITYEYDEMNRLKKIIDRNNKETAFTYDCMNLKEKSMGNEGSVGTVNYSAYDGNNRLKTITYSDSPTVSFTYDNNGNRTTMTDSLGTTTYTYDALDRLSSVIDPFDKTVSYTYDPATNKKTITYPGNKAVAYEYDQLNRLWKVNDWLGYTTTYAYDNRGNLSAVSNTKGTHADYTYDIANRLKTASDTTSADTTISNFQFTLDKVGNRTNATMSIPLASAFTTKGINATYDPANQVESWDSATFGFDDAGRQTVMTDGATTNYTYNLEDRLTGINNGTDTYQYQYNGAGDRLASTANGTEKRYVLDLNGNMSRVLCETDASGNITAYYVYGLGLLYKITPTDERYHYHFDPIGSTIAITDVDETITDKYAYSPFGELMNEEVTTENPFRYVGQFGVMDEGNGLLFMRARFYDPETKRFLSRDPVKGEIRDTQILNFHQYARNNPAIYVDYKGESYSFIGDIVSFSVNVKNKDISGLVGMAAIGGITILRNVAEKAAYLSTTAAATTKLATMATAATVVGAGFVALEGGYGLAAIGEGAYHGWKSDYNPRSEELGVALGGYVAGNILGGITRGLTNLALTGQYASGDLKDAEGGLIGMNNKVAEFLSTMKTAHDVIKQSENMKSSSPAVIIKWNTIKYLSVELKVSPKTLLMGGI